MVVRFVGDVKICCQFLAVCHHCAMVVGLGKVKKVKKANLYSALYISSLSLKCLVTLRTVPAVFDINVLVVNVFVI